MRLDFLSDGPNNEPVAEVTLEQLTKTFHTATGEQIRAVDHLCFAVGKGELLVLLGPSGGGKTTTLRLIAGLETPDEGIIRIGGKVVNATPAGERDIGMVFQRDALYPHMTVSENISFGLKVRGVGGPLRDARVRETAELLRVADCLSRFPAELSGGQRQRVALARALARQPSLLLLDEPFSNLDPALRGHLRAELSRLRATLHTTALFVTHDQAEAMSLGDRVGVIAQGSLLQIAPPMELYNQPANLFVATFVGTPPMNLFQGCLVERQGSLWFEERGTVGGCALTLPLMTSAHDRLRQLQPAPAIVLGLRPEHIQRSDEAGGGDCLFVADRVETLGPELLVSFTSASGSFSARLAPRPLVRPGETLSLRFQADCASFFDPTSGKRLG